MSRIMEDYLNSYSGPYGPSNSLLFSQLFVLDSDQVDEELNEGLVEATNQSHVSQLVDVSRLPSYLTLSLSPSFPDQFHQPLLHFQLQPQFQSHPFDSSSQFATMSNRQGHQPSSSPLSPPCHQDGYPSPSTPCNPWADQGDPMHHSMQSPPRYYLPNQSIPPASQAPQMQYPDFMSPVSPYLGPDSPSPLSLQSSPWHESDVLLYQQQQQQQQLQNADVVSMRDLEAGYISSGSSGKPSNITQGLPNETSPYAHWLYECLKTAPNHQMSLRDIYDWAKVNVPKVTEAIRRDPNDKGWQNSIRHNLSMNGGFEIIDLDDSKDGKKVSAWRVTTNSLAMGGVASTTRYRKGPNPKRRQQQQQQHHQQQQLVQHHHSHYRSHHHQHQHHDRNSKSFNIRHAQNGRVARSVRRKSLRLATAAQRLRNSNSNNAMNGASVFTSHPGPLSSSPSSLPLQMAYYDEGGDLSAVHSRDGGGSSGGRFHPSLATLHQYNGNNDNLMYATSSSPAGASSLPESSTTTTTNTNNNAAGATMTPSSSLVAGPFINHRLHQSIYPISASTQTGMKYEAPDPLLFDPEYEVYFADEMSYGGI